MKKIYTSILFIFAFYSYSQNIVIPDPEFKGALLYASDTHLIAQNLAGEYFSPDANGDGEISVSEAANVKSFYFLYFGNATIDFTGIEYFVNLESIYAPYLQATTIDFTNLTHFKSLSAESSNLTTLDFANAPDLRYLYCPSSQLTSLNLMGCNVMEDINVNNNNLTNLDIHAYGTGGDFGALSIECATNMLTSFAVEGNFAAINLQNNQLTDVDFSNVYGSPTLIIAGNPLVHLNIKNGEINNFQFGLPDTPIAYICADEGYEYDSIIEYYTNDGVTGGYELNSYCSVAPGGTYYTVQGSTLVYSNGLCEGSGFFYPYPNIQVTNASDVTANYIGDANGNYHVWQSAGTYNFAPQIEHPAYFTVNPPSVSLTLGTDNAPIIQNFCVTPNGSHPDVAVSIIPLGPARPGFDATYKITYRNVGSETVSGTVNLTFDDAVTDFVSAIPATAASANNLDWSFTNLQPFESKTILITLNLNAPTETPALNGGDVLSFVATATIAGDENTADNTAPLEQTSVNSFDPNDKTCIEGDVIAESQVGGFVNYIIRFENTGSAEAVNVFVRDAIDTTKFDLATLEPLGGSHPYFTRFDGNKVLFVFENINLPFDDANNDGYVNFRIKTQPNLVLNDTFSNTAAIYFDYNFPILTNTATTSIAILAVKDFDFANYFTLYPNPANDVLNMQTKGNIAVTSATIYNVLGQLVLAVPSSGALSKIDISELKAGNYFIKINSDKGTSNAKFIKM